MNQEHNENMGASHITMKNYLIGFILAVVFTIISFGVVVAGVSKPASIILLFAAAVLQMLVHLRYFLHLNGSSEQRWNVIVLAFTALMLLIFIGGTIWVMYTLNSRMM
jgi:cytochrome o ubiquinol oxidase subunit IV